MTTAASNRLEGKITELQPGEVITRRSAEEMNRKVGDTASAVIKSTEVTPIQSNHRRRRV